MSHFSERKNSSEGDEICSFRGYSLVPTNNVVINNVTYTLDFLLMIWSHPVTYLFDRINR